MNGSVVRGRHEKGYTAAGLPIVVHLPDRQCADALETFLAARQVDYGATTGKPVGGWAWVCCDAFCTPAEIAGGDCFKEATCWPLGPGPGITKRVVVYAFDVQSCLSARNKKVTLLYDATTHCWLGDLTGLIGCTLHLKFCCNAGLPTAPGKLTLSWTSTPAGDTGSLTVGYSCSDPLGINFGQANFPVCCDCHNTNTPASINFWAVANCRPVRMGRFIDYDGTGVPLVAKALPCPWDSGATPTCGDLTCGLRARTTNVSGCACMGGADFILEYGDGPSGAGVWSSGFSVCGDSVIWTLTCADNHDGTLTFTMTVACGADSTGTGSMVINADGLDTIDVTIPVHMTVGSDGSCCTGTVNVRITR